MNILKSRRKAFLLLTMLLTVGMASAQVVIKGTVYGGGEGIHSDQNTGLVTGNTKIILNGGIVERSLYGGGELGSVGTFTDFYTEATGAHVVGEPKTCATGTGKTEVLIRGGQVGRNEAYMPEAGATTYEDDLGYVFCGSRGESDSLTYPLANLFAVVKETHLKISGSALITASAYGGCENGLVLGDTHVEITGGQIGTGYNQVTDEHDDMYTEEQWNIVIQKIKNGTFTDADASAFHECDHWPYGDGNGNYYSYDIYAEEEGYDSHGGALYASDGHTFYGNVFGGGSGYYPFWDEENNKAVWRRSAGRVWGNTVVDITGGHILTNIYGGNEQTDVMGNSTVNMTGGTLGVPRALQDIQNHPVTCYLFGAGKGDPRIMFNTWTNVENSVVNIGDDAFFFGSVFGGGEDGHVLSDVTMNIAPGVHIGTYGYSYVDGNVFGGGRGFSGEALTAGSVGGNVMLNISGGTMLGSIYGGGRLASVGTPFVMVDDPNYGQVQPDDYSDPEYPVTHGHVTVNITGGVIGNDYESKLHVGNPAFAEGHSNGGNVFGGSMGRLTLLDGTTVNPSWTNLGKVKNTFITISGDNTIIKGSVYGGSELGTLSSNENDVNAGKPSGNATVTINGGTIWRNVYGGSYGSDNTTMLAPLHVHNQYIDETVMVSPMQRAGRIDGNTKVEINGGWVKKCVYGGGELASVGTLTEWPIIHDDVEQGFALSWPYEFNYAENTGIDSVIINNGRIGLTGKDYMGPWNTNGQPIYYDEDDESQSTPIVYDLTDADQVALLKAAREDNGDVYGGGKGIAGDRYVMAHCANSNNTVVIIDYPNNNATPENYKPTYSGGIDYETNFYSKWSEWTGFGSLGCLSGALYGGGENGHVNEDAHVTLEKGLIGHNIYGGGKGSDTYTVTLEHYNDHPNGDWHIGDEYEAEITSLTAGKVYRNTYVTVNDGYVVRNVFGGGNRASVGKGNYAGGPGDYQVNGYGERWTTAEMRELLINSGHTYVDVYGGQIGTVDGDKDDLPTGNVFGSSRGEPAPNVPSTLSPRYHYCPEFFSGYVNHTHVTIGENPNATPDENSPRLYGSVYGGGQDGHVRWGTEVVVNDAEIGNEYVNPTTAEELVGTADTLHFQWLARGNVYGAGSGTGTYKDLYNVKQHSNSSGSVTHFTSVTINGGLIHRNVYGGGSLASVGPPRIPPLTYDANRSQTLATVNINGTIGKLSDVNGSYNDGGVTKKFSYGGHVFGGSRGDLTLDETSFSTSIYTEVNIGVKNADNTTVPGYVLGNVYGGGEVGIVKQCTEVNMNAGEVGTIGYTWKHNTNHAQPYDSIFHTSGGKLFGGGKGHISKVNAALVMDSTVVNINGGHVFFNVHGGGEKASVGESEEYTYTYTDANNQTVSAQDFKPKAGGYAMVTITGGQLGPAPGTGTYLGHPYDVYIGLNGVDGYAFGGGEGIGKDPNELYKSFANVNYASVEVNMPMDDGSHTNRLWGSIFGGGEDGHVLGSDTVRFVSGLMGTYGTTSYDGNIFGGGRNYNRTNLTAGRVRGNITVEMSGGQLYGSVFGGGRLGGTGIDYNGLIIPDQEGENGEKYGHVAVKVMGGKVGNDNLTNTNSDNPNETIIETFTKYTMGDVFGGGKGSTAGVVGQDRSTAMLLSITKNTDVEISQKDPDIPTIILGSVFGGGEVANVGTSIIEGDGIQGITGIEPVEGTGLAKVTVKGGRIGYNRMRMRHTIVDDPNDPNYLSLRYNDDVGHVYGGGQGMVADPDAPANDPVNPEVCGGDYQLADVMAVVFNSEVSIEGGWVKGSVYGGGLNGRVWWDTDVKIKGGLIGAGDNGTSDEQYDDDDFFNPIAYFDPLTPANNYVAPSDVASDKALAECAHWEFGKTYTDGGTSITRYDCFDPVLIKEGRTPSDGKTWFGNVYGGGSGYYPFVRKDGNNYVSVWNPKSACVGGNTRVEITGGHILTSVYGGNELTEIGTYNDDGTVTANTGQTTVVMRNSTVTQGDNTVTIVPTLGVPRTLSQINDHPVTCYLYGAGKGEADLRLNQYNKVASTDVTVSGGIIYGSIFGGGEEGHVLGDAETKVEQGESFEVNDNTYYYPIVGTTGRSYVDGNVFGGGRGFSGENSISGSVGGNAEVTISGGNMLGSIYGGGRLGSVGIDIAEQIVDPEHANQMIVNPNYGEIQDGDDHGIITVTIDGGIIGNDYEAIYHTRFDTISVGGNVFTGCMGRLTLLDNTTNPIWPKLARAKETVLNITKNADATIAPPVIKGNAYGGGAYGTVAENATIDISGGEIWRDVYGGGYGSSNITMTAAFTPADATESTILTPMQLAGRVFGNTDIDISGGWIKRCVYGGGDFASIGYVTDSIKHIGTEQLELSWPFEFRFKENTGKADIDVISGRIGIIGKDFMGPYAWINGELVEVDDEGQQLTPQQIKDARVDNGDVYGGCKGLAGEHYLMSHLASVNETDVYIHYADSCNAEPTTYKNLGKGCIAGALYGGGENGHVHGNTKIQLDHGLVGHAVYGGGKGKDKYKDANNNEVYSLTAGKVYGNTVIEINGGYVVRSVFGGGNLASVGKGNYLGYGENATGSAYLTAAEESGHTYITVTGGILGMLDATNPDDVFKDNIPYGSVFGGCRGEVVADEMDLFGHVNNTHVVIGTENAADGPKLYGSVYGSSQDGHVRWNTETIVYSGEIGVEFNDDGIAEVGSSDPNSVYWMARGNVFGGGSGLNTYKDDQNQDKYNPNAGSVTCNTKVVVKGGNVRHDVFGGGNRAVVGKFSNHWPHPTSETNEGHTRVFIDGGTVDGSVFGGGNMSFVEQERVATVSGGTIKGDVYGGSNNAVPDLDTTFLSLKTVNVRGGHIMGNVFGCSYDANEGADLSESQLTDPSNVTVLRDWNGFVNISGGIIDHDVFAAGKGGIVNGSLDVNIGATAIANTYAITGNTNKFRYVTIVDDEMPTTSPVPDKDILIIGGDVYGGSDHYCGDHMHDDPWNAYDVNGYSVTFIDGTNYNTTSSSESAANYMNIGGGLYGSGKHCESAVLGRHILLKEYGTRNETNGEMTSATRTLTTIQRSGNVIIDHANVNLSGLTDISNTDNQNIYGVMRVNDTLAVINAGGIVLGASDAYAHMDSIYSVQSLNLANSSASIYDHNINELNKHSWYWLGIKDENNSAKLYNITGTGSSAHVVGDPLTFAQENVVLYNDTSKLWVRYHDMKDDDTEYKQYYGELLGFFRMRGDYYHPTLKVNESFAYARPKITNDHEFDDDNIADGGWLSYNTGFNYFTDLGDEFTHTQQYPYINVLDYTRGDREDYRMWVDVSRKRRWYVDGTRGWGRDDMKKYRDQAGFFPDKPKKTLYGKNGDKGSGIVSEVYTANDLLYLNYSHKDDIIYVVGALSAEDEKEMLRDSTYVDDLTRYPLKLYRYPGGHPMSNDSIDFGGRKTPVWGVPNGNAVEYKLTHAGPGANYGAMLNVQANAQIEMLGVEMDGLYAFNDEDKELHMIPTDYEADSINFHQDQVTMPLAVTHENSMIGLRKFTVLKRGYNSTNADVWYTDSDYKPAAGVYHGGAIFVDSLAIVNVFGLDSITIVDNKQYLEIEGENAEVIESNVYLPTFVTHLYIPEAVAPKTRIGVTSPKRNKEPNYVYNTFSPVAEVYDTVSGWNQVAQDVWTNNNFYDDLNWFFVNGHSDQDESTKRTTYFENFSGDPSKTVYFGWTWANVVRKMPENGYEISGNNISISSENGLAWLISVVNGMNRQTASSLSNKTVSLVTAATGDIKDIYDMQQYVWVPVGDPSKTSFAGTFDGNGHLLTNIYVPYLGKGDRRYELNDYGMFGSVNGTVKRTFLVSGMIRPVHTIEIGNKETVTYNVGGLVGTLEGNNAMVFNSEAAMEIIGTQKQNLNVFAGGLVGKMENGEIHSSMAMPDMNLDSLTMGPVGGLVGSAENGKINNSFANGKFKVTVAKDNANNRVKTIGGLLGTNTAAVMNNCYVELQPGCDSINSNNFGSIVHTTSGNIDSCYVMQDTLSLKLALVGIDNLDGKYCGKYMPTITADELGYMYADNRVKVGASTDTTMFVLLNAWVDKNNKTDHKYARWARPGLSEINGDLPVLMLDDYDATANHQGDFRSVGTFAGGPVLQYGGPVRDNVEVDGALARTKAVASNKDYLFIYGDVNTVDIASNEITQSKVSIYEHAAILSVGSLSEYNSTYVGITFDNSRRHALSTHGVNGLGMQDLPRDWHMFSTPLSDAPLGFDYTLNNVDHNVDTYVPGTYYNNNNYYNNPWEGKETEFTWLNGGDEGDKRYWMKEYTDADGYFPTKRGALFSDSNGNLLQSEIGNLFIEDSDEFPGYDENNNPRNRYPYGMDFFTWNEPKYHWINFKRNGPNHWHSDEPHYHLDYYATTGADKNVNEDTLIKGRGYMAAISIPTFLQSHGKLNNGSQSINLTSQGIYCTGWNLVGNPFHGYLDFDVFATQNGLGENAFYYIYDADGYTLGAPESAFLVYPSGGSKNGAYAGKYLHPHQAFFVLADSDNQVLNFNQRMIVPRSMLGVTGDFDGHFRDDEWQPEYPLINLFLSSDHGCSDVTVIEFERPEWGGAMKLSELRNGNGMFYGYHDQGHYAALFAPEGTQRVPLWFEAKEDDFFTMKWNTANGDFSSLYLIDNIKGVQYDMLANDAYTFEGHKDDYYSRFYIVFNVTGLEEHTGYSFAFYDGSQWVVTGEGELDFIDLQGRVLWHGKLSGGQSRINFPVVAKGMYLLRLVNSNETKVQKIIVK